MSNDNTQQNTVQDRARQLTKQVSDLIDLLRGQRKILQQRGMNLPSGSMDNLRTLKTKIDGLARQLMNVQVELRQLRTLADNYALIASTLDTDTVLNQIMDTVVNLTGAERGYIVMKNRQTGAFDQFRVARGIETSQLYDRSDDPSNKKSELIVSKTIVNEVANSGQPVLTDNASADEKYANQASIVGFALRSILAVPLKLRDEVLGVVYCDNRVMSGLFQPSDLNILAAFADQAGVAIENARLFETTRLQLAQITELRDQIGDIFESIANAVITTDSNGIVTTCNSAARQIAYYDGMTIGETLDTILPMVKEPLAEMVKLVQDDGKQQTRDLTPFVEGYREERDWVVIVSPLRDAETGISQGVTVVIDDLTEQKRHEAQLKELRRYLPGALVENFGSMEDVDVAGQEREISVIATDVRGFTTFSEKLEPEMLMEIINQYLSLASDAINLYEGIVDKYMGDAVTGLFNTQLNPQDDHAFRAVQAAMSIIYDLYALHEVLPEDQRLFYGIGIHTGPAFLGNVGSEDRQEFSALGEASTIAKILEGNAKAGEIIISEATYEIVKDAYECEPRTPDESKTKGFDLGTVYKVIKRRKGSRTGTLFVDPELADMLKELEEDIIGNDESSSD